MRGWGEETAQGPGRGDRKEDRLEVWRRLGEPEKSWLHVQTWKHLTGRQLHRQLISSRENRNHSSYFQQKGFSGGNW